MNDKEFNLDALANADDETAAKIAVHCPASDEEKERMFAMSRRIYNKRTEESNNTENIEVTGVERYKKPILQRIMSIAAALVLVAGIGTGGALMLKHRSAAPQTEVPQNQTTASSTEAVSPFGDLSGYEVKVKTTNSNELIELDEERSRSLINAFNKGEWNQMPNDTEADPAVTEAIHVVLTKGDDTLFCLLYHDKYILCDRGPSQTKWEVSEKIKNAVYEAASYAMSIIDRRIAEEQFKIKEEIEAAEAKAAEAASAANEEMIEIPNTEFMQKDLAADILKETGLNVEFANQESNDIQPGYVIKSEPSTGEKVSKGATVRLYVSMGANSQTIITEDYKGMNADDAVILAEYRSLKVRTEEINSSEKAGIVVGQEPQPGEETEAGSEIILYVSNGNPPV